MSLPVYQCKWEWFLQTTPWWEDPWNHGYLMPWLSKMAESVSVREPYIISWQLHINNKAHNAKCECLSLHKDAQQVHLSLLHFHFVQQRAPLCQLLLSESFGWSFFYVPLPRMHNIPGPHDNRLVGTQRKERDACQSGYICVWLKGDCLVHDTSVTRHPETLFPLSLLAG